MRPFHHTASLIAHVQSGVQSIRPILSAITTARGRAAAIASAERRSASEAVAGTSGLRPGRSASHQTALASCSSSSREWTVPDIGGSPPRTDRGCSLHSSSVACWQQARGFYRCWHGRLPLPCVPFNEPHTPRALYLRSVRLLFFASRVSIGSSTALSEGRRALDDRRRHAGRRGVDRGRLPRALGAAASDPRARAAASACYAPPRLRVTL